jgi:hypothetical protein
LPPGFLHLLFPGGFLFIENKNMKRETQDNAPLSVNVGWFGVKFLQIPRVKAWLQGRNVQYVNYDNIVKRVILTLYFG